jgi:hypothetical protein
VLRPPVAGADDATPDHAVVLLVDVIDSKEQARELLQRVATELTEREATPEPLMIGEIEATKWSFKQPRGLREKQFAYHGIIGRWLLACDNEAVFRDVVAQIVGNAAGAPKHLADSPAFKSIVEKSKFAHADYTAHVRWFIEPFGYMYLAQAIADAKNGGEGLRNDYADIFHKEGFSVVKGVGGMASLATGKHEAVHRTFIYAPVSEEHPLERGAAMLDFTNPDGSPLDPPMWVPENAASYLTFTWDLKKALEKVGHIADSIAGTPGSWERTLDGLRDDVNGPRVDLRTVVSLLENRVTVSSVTQLPIDENSEQILFGIKINDDEAFVADSVFRMVKNDAEVIDYHGNRILVVDTAEEFEDLNLDIDSNLLDAEFDSEFGDLGGGQSEVDEEEIKKPKPLFEKRVFAVTHGVLLISNNLDQMKSVIDQFAKSSGELLADADDYRRVTEALTELAGETPPSFRHFGRMDQAIRANYEMMRTGKMAQSKTMLAQILNRAYTDEKATTDVDRVQKIDGSKMPEDFEGKVAPYFGPTGLVIQTVDDGWLITGCVLKKEMVETAKSISQDEAKGDDR